MTDTVEYIHQKLDCIALKIEHGGANFTLNNTHAAYNISYTWHSARIHKDHHWLHIIEIFNNPVAGA
jgi:hypothetical protein